MSKHNCSETSLQHWSYFCQFHPECLDFTNLTILNCQAEIVQGKYFLKYNYLILLNLKYAAKKWLRLCFVILYYVEHRVKQTNPLLGI